MSKYTTELRFICETASGLDMSKGYNDVNTIITNAIPKVFDFSFPIFDEAYREILERKILKHFYTREICEETVGLWKLRLDTRLNEIMPYFNKLYESELLDFNPLYNVSVSRKGNNKYNSERNTENKESGNGSNSNTSWDLYSDTPQGALSGVESETYLTNARKNTDKNRYNNSANSKGKDKLGSLEDYSEMVSGLQGVSGSELLKKFRDTFLNIDMMVIENLEDLFFALW